MTWCTVFMVSHKDNEHPSEPWGWPASWWASRMTSILVGHEDDQHPDEPRGWPASWWATRMTSILVSHEDYQHPGEPREWPRRVTWCTIVLVSHNDGTRMTRYMTITTASGWPEAESSGAAVRGVSLCWCIVPTRESRSEIFTFFFNKFEGLTGLRHCGD